MMRSSSTPRSDQATSQHLETPGQRHAVSRNASATRPAKLLAIMLAPKGQPRTTLAQE